MPIEKDGSISGKDENIDEENDLSYGKPLFSVDDDG